MACEIRIGTSGWSYQHWRGPFFPERFSAASMLGYYAAHFDTVEINGSFYRLPPESALDSWRDTAPPGFCFAAKASRFITHMKKLKDPKNAVDALIPRLERLGDRLGPILFQLPPAWGCNAERLAALLGILPARHRYAFEFRDDSWHTPEIYQLLRRHGAALCIYHLAGYQSPMELTTDFAYVRLHGPAAAYAGNYNNAALRRWAQRIHDWEHDLQAIYVYFDNDEAGFAPRNALELKELL